MQLTKLKPRKALNKAFLKAKPNRSDIESFKDNMIKLLDRANDQESEEFHKNLVSDFLKQTYYRDQHFINTKGRNDLVIHNGKNAKSPVGVVIEAKKPTNKSEMVRQDKVNTKAFHELVLYYLRERITANNLEMKYLVVTNLYEWFIFDANVFEKAFASNKKLVKQFEDFEAGRLAGKTTDFFYKEIAEPFVDQLEEVEFTHFDLHKYERPLRNNDKKDDSKLIALFKLLSPEHLLKLPFANDSNSLDKRFYAELLHIIGLTETKQGGKKLIEREKAASRNNGSLLENTIKQLETFDKTRYVNNPSQYGESREEKLFGIGLELCITWMNRVLFLKLLEAQLLSYHKGDSDFKFLDFKKIGNYDKLNLLFFQVLAQREEDRSKAVTEEFKNVPYLNSSLFDHTELEHQALFVAQLADELTIPIYSGSVLKDKKGKRRTGEINTLQYLFEFLDAYDFSSEGSEEIQEDNKTLINASVLGLIFEKINGYKDGSFFTPGFITMYMCRETIRRAVLQKFNERKSWKCKTLDDLYDKIEDRNEANDIVNSIKICDPAVGSGHFLVSALNEIIAVKNDLKILQDRNGRRLKEYQVEVVNDELIVTDEEGELFEYSPTSKESQRIQETLFHEKQTIIENCLFGVDINNNSVKICRLRLWIELLKSAYYRTQENQLETLPNIDINIKAGNSLISRFELDADLKKALKKSNFSIDSYRAAVDTYRNARNKDEKRQMMELIDKIKSDFRTEIGQNSKEQKQLHKLNAELYQKYTAPKMFEEELTPAQNKKLEKERKTLEAKIEKLVDKIEAIKSNKIYENAFEWRFEFPEVLDENGDFIGFDVVIGNPPYLSSKSFAKNILHFLKENYETAEYQFDLYVAFIEKGRALLKKQGLFSFITPNSWLKNLKFSKCREFVLKELNLLYVFPNLSNVFEEASVDTSIFLAAVSSESEKLLVMDFKNEIPQLKHGVDQNRFADNYGKVFDVEASDEVWRILKHIRNNSEPLENYSEITRGVNPYDKYRGQSEEVIKSKAYHSNHKKDETFVPEIRGKHVDTFTVNWDNKHWISYGNWLAAPREWKYFSGSRIIMRQVLGTRLKTTLLEDDFVIDQSVFIAKLKNQFANLKYSVTGQLASKLMLFYFSFSSNEFDDLFPKIKIGEFRMLPVHNDTSYDDNISSKVIEVLKLKNEDPAADTSKMESDIDDLVYQLYGLTEEEIEVVEKAFNA